MGRNRPSLESLCLRRYAGTPPSAPPAVGINELTPKSLDKEHKRASLRRRRRRYRERLKRGACVAPVELDGPIIALLVRVGIATEAQVAADTTQVGRRELGAAIAAFFRRNAL
jgi:hypothetical protein